MGKVVAEVMEGLQIMVLMMSNKLTIEIINEGDCFNMICEEVP